MKPKKLRLKNFGPFIDETIDFFKLTNAPLFLITGKTGAGKTTLFDGMTYALFGETSGRIRTGKEMRSLFATPEEETCVFFSFEHQRMYYEIERKPEQLLAKRKGKGDRKQAAKVSLTIFDENGEEMRQFTKRSEVDRLIKELMNLDAKQFSQIVLLPQGEFRNFLISSSNEKEIVLRNLFGTQFFQRFNEQLKEKTKLYQKKVDHLEQELMRLQKQFVPIEEEIIPENLNFERMLTYWQEEQETLQKRMLKEKEILSNLQKKQKQMEEAYYHAKTLQMQHEEKLRLSQRQEKLFQRENEINEKKQWVVHYEFAEKLVDSLTRRQEYQKEQEELDVKEMNCFEKLSQRKQIYAQWKTRESKRLNTKQKIELAANTLQEIKRLVPIAKERQKKQIELEVLLAEKKEAEDKKQKIIQEQQQIQEKQSQLQEQLAGQEHLYEDQLSYEKLRQEQEKYQTLIEQYQQNEAQLKTSEIKLIEITKQQQTNQILLNEQIKQVDMLKSQWASQQILRMQLLLLPGEPCPVCGCLVHSKQPDTHDLPKQEEIIKLEEKLAQTQKQLEQLNQTIGRNEADEAQIKQMISELSKFRLEKQVEIIQRKDRLSYTMEQLFNLVSDDPLDSLKEIHKDLAKRREKMAQAKVVYQTMTEQLTVITDKLNNMETQLLQNEEKTQQGKGEIAGLSKQLGTCNIQTLAEDIKRLEKDISTKEKWLTKENEMGTSFSQEIALLQAQLETIREQQAKNIKKLQSIQERISLKLIKQDYFKCADDVLLFAGKTSEYKQKRQLIAAYEEERLIVKDRLNQLKMLSLEGTLPDLNQLKQQIVKLKEEIARQQEICYCLHEQKNKNQQIIEEFSTIYQESQEQIDELIQLQQLSQTINGENSRKTSLERYVLQVYLQEVLQVANSCLKRLTKNRYQFELAEEVGSYRGKTGLEINIYDDEAGLTRGAHTLSGGESFIAALSLALALAEVIQTQTGSIAIEALFIDEGFGSLDEEALEMAIEALETIESEGRMIGIISHVRELKERIVQQIRIETQGSGQSKVRYRGIDHL
ncbi:AAA family ATPase [Enterococcus ratti]|uniref:Nuclease SbcCD subunit C n=1 Tax=Enterococcus ratti TaxID=150033 RepID=A0A1L8WHL5_9ENTE|nr:SMC family ATPase [Enterococcus ratti]OJG80520.1 exonuclease SbcC [Enterococcus ratti]